MAKYSKYNFVYLMQKWMDSVAGQTFMNYAYSWGAAVVILGTLFKLTHLTGADIMLFIGMGTEVFVFFIAAFDRPFDKTTDGMDLATDTELEAERQRAEGRTTEDVAGLTGTVIFGNGVFKDNGGEADGNNENATQKGGGTVIGGGTIVGGGFISGGIVGGGIVGGGTVSGNVLENAEGEAVEGQNVVIGAPAPAVTPETAMAMEEATTTYVDRLNELNELLLKVGAQSERLTTDSQEMENLNRTLTGISRVYEMQLKSASQQITTQDEINEQTRKLAQQISELNAIYARMIEAMSVNMKTA